jgi:hypothetical protein
MDVLRKPLPLLGLRYHYANLCARLNADRAFSPSRSRRTARFLQNLWADEPETALVLVVVRIVSTVVRNRAVKHKAEPTAAAGVHRALHVEAASAH